MVKRTLGHVQIVSFRGLIQTFRRASCSFHMRVPPPGGGRGISFVVHKVRVRSDDSRTAVETKTDGGVRKTSHIHPQEFECMNYPRTQQTTFPIGPQNVDLSADVRFPMYTNFKGVPTAVVRLTWFVFAQKQDSCEVTRSPAAHFARSQRLPVGFDTSC